MFETVLPVRFLLNFPGAAHIAKNMISHLISKGKKHYKNKICLEVNCSNILALKLYSYLGFKKVGVRKEYYQDGMDAILMDLCI